MNEMNPETPQPTPMSQPPGGSAPAGNFQGDKAFVGLDVLLYIVSGAWSYTLMPGRVDEAMLQMKNSPNGGAGAPSREVIEMWTMGFTGGCMCIALIIYIFLWLNMIKGKKWAFITMLVFTILGLAFSAMGLAGVGMGMAVMGLVTGFVKIVYMIMRMMGKVGPALR